MLGRTESVLFALAAIVAMGAIVNACSPSASDTVATFDVEMAPVDRLPSHIKDAPVTVTRAYQFALANAALLSRVPCYCGCGSMGHTSNAACYLVEPDNLETSAIETHAVGCSICVDITIDVMRLKQQDRGLADILDYVDATYARYGPSNLP